MDFAANNGRFVYIFCIFDIGWIFAGEAKAPAIRHLVKMFAGGHRTD